METDPSRSGSAPTGEPPPAPPAASTAPNPPFLVPPDDASPGKETLRDEPKDEARVSGDEKNENDAGGLAARAAALLDAGAADAWLSTRAGVPKKEDIAEARVVDARETPKANDANDADDADDAEEEASAESASRTPANAGRSASASGVAFDSTSSPLTPAERMASDPSRIHSLAKRATAEMATLRGELESERAATRLYKAELFRLRKNAETRVAAGVAAVTSAADSAKDAAAIRADVIERATAAEGHAAAFYRRAIEAERLLRVERDRNNSLVAALNAAGTAAAEATRALSERAERAEALAKELEAKVSDAEARADEAMGIARAATRNAADTARAAGLDGLQRPSGAGAFKRAANVVGAARRMRLGLSAAEGRDASSGGSLSFETPKKTRPAAKKTVGFTSSFAPPSETKARATSPGRRCAACAARAMPNACVACDPASFTDANDFGEIRVPTAAVKSAAWTGDLSRVPERFPLRPRPPVTLEGDARVRVIEEEDERRDVGGERSRTGARFSSGPSRTAEPSRAAETRNFLSAKEKKNETVKSEDRNTEARLCELEGRMALAAAELELDRERRDERRAATSPGAENRRRRRRERAEVAAKLDATEARLSAMRLEDARKAQARLAKAEEDTASLSLRRERDRDRDRDPTATRGEP